MVRPLRIEYPNAWYHVTSRGVLGLEIFRDDKDRKRFLDILKESVEIFQVEVHCYVLMSNHFHFLLKTREANLGRFMQRFNTAYTTYFNLRHQRAGHLYQGRYKAILVQADEYLLELSRYIHLNPVRIEKYRDLSRDEKRMLLKGYRCSSLPGYFKTSGRNDNDLVSYGMVLSRFGGDTIKGRAGYRNFVLKGLASETENPLNEVKGGSLLGTDSFIALVKKKYISETDFQARAYSHLKSIRRPVPISRIAAAVAKEYGVDAEEIIKKRPACGEARLVLLGISHRLNLRKRSMRDMGTELGSITGEQISHAYKVMQKRLQEDKRFQSRVKNIISRLNLLFGV